MPHFGVPRNGMRKKFILGVGIPVFLLLLHTESHTFAYTAHTSYTYIPTYTPLNAKPHTGPVYSCTYSTPIYGAPTFLAYGTKKSSRRALRWDIGPNKRFFLHLLWFVNKYPFSQYSYVPSICIRLSGLTTQNARITYSSGILSGKALKLKLNAINISGPLRTKIYIYSSLMYLQYVLI